MSASDSNLLVISVINQRFKHCASHKGNGGFAGWKKNKKTKTQKAKYSRVNFIVTPQYTRAFLLTPSCFRHPFTTPQVTVRTGMMAQDPHIEIWRNAEWNWKENVSKTHLCDGSAMRWPFNETIKPLPIWEADSWSSLLYSRSSLSNGKHILHGLFLLHQNT